MVSRSESRQIVEQIIDAPRRGTFLKELIVADGPTPIAMVRKRRAKLPTSTAASDAEALPCRASVLLIHGYAQNRYAFHLPGRSMSAYLAQAGFDVYNVDLRGRGHSRRLGARRPHSVFDFIHEDVPAALAAIREHSGPAPVFLVGHSLGGVVSYCVAADRPNEVAGVVTLGSPYHFTRGSLWLSWAAVAFTALDATVRLPNVVIPARTYGRFVRAARALVESRLHPLPFRGFHRGSMEPEILEQHMALAMDRGSLSTMRQMFRGARAGRTKRRTPAEGLFGYAGRVDAMDVPLLVIAGKHDDLAPPRSVKPAWERSRSTDKTYREFPMGHIDLLVGRDAPMLTWPMIERWMARRVPEVAAPVSSGRAA